MRSLSPRAVALPVGGSPHAAAGGISVGGIAAGRCFGERPGSSWILRSRVGGGLSAQTILSGSSLTHTFTVAGTTTTKTEPLSDPDDITRLRA